MTQAAILQPFSHVLIKQDPEKLNECLSLLSGANIEALEHRKASDVILQAI